ncbi:MAG: hypothetical protein H6698_06430 [Myxococcales bacterium]|nr:hypothetical protein [Myxococcales bacterium]MCB9533943.1 hypothetical protein [Myxococcales bacterium]
MRLARTLPGALALASTVACGGANVVDEPHAVESDPIGALITSDPARATVLVLGTVHEAHLQSGYPLDIVERVVRRFDPDIVLVELTADELEGALASYESVGSDALPADITDARLRVLPELYRVVFPLRDELGFRVLGVAGLDAAAAADRDTYILAEPHGPAERDYVLAAARFQTQFIAHGGYGDSAWLNSEAYEAYSGAVARWLSFYSEEAMGRGGPLHSNARAMAAIEDVLAGAAGQRVLVVYHVDERWYLEPAIEVLESATVVSIDPFLAE